MNKKFLINIAVVIVGLFNISMGFNNISTNKDFSVFQIILGVMIFVVGFFNVKNQRRK